MKSYTITNRQATREELRDYERMLARARRLVSGPKAPALFGFGGNW